MEQKGNNNCWVNQKPGRGQKGNYPANHECQPTIMELERVDNRGQENIVSIPTSQKKMSLQLSIRCAEPEVMEYMAEGQQRVFIQFLEIEET